MAYECETVKEVTVTLTGLVRKYTFVSGEVVYDWVTDNDDSDEAFETAEDAEYDLKHHY